MLPQDLANEARRATLHNPALEVFSISSPVQSSVHKLPQLLGAVEATVARAHTKAPGTAQQHLQLLLHLSVLPSQHLQLVMSALLVLLLVS
jgi:hypothetical protein